MRRPGVVLRRQPVIKPGVSGLRLIGTVELAVAMPLASHTGRIAGLLQKLRQSQFRTPQVNLLTSIRSRFGGCRNPVVHSRSIRRTTGHQANSGRRTDGRRRIEIREANSFPSEPVDVLRPDVRMTVDSDNVAKPRPMCHATPWRDSRHGVAAHNFARTLRSCATATRWYRKQPVANSHPNDSGSPAQARRDLASLPDSHSTSYSLASESSAFTICTSFMPLSRTISALALFFPVISIAVALIRPDAS